MTVLKHSGVAHDDGPPGRGSGRFAWGSGNNPGQHQFSFLSEVDRLRKKGLKDAEIAKMLIGAKRYTKAGEPIWATTTDLRAEISIQKSLDRKMNRDRALQMLDSCGGNVSEAARKLGMKNESSLRSLLSEAIAERQDRYQNTADTIRKIVDEKGIVDISKGTELYLNVNRHTFDVAVAILEKDGYLKSWADIPQLGTTHDTTLKVIAKPGITHADIQKNKLDIAPIRDFSPDEGKTWWTPQKPVSVDRKRILIKYDEDGGSEKDGVIELRRGVDDISLGNSQYAQVRIGVNDTHYMKGMAMYGDIPEGYDIVYNSNKKRGTPDEKVFKEMKHIMKDGVDTGEVDWENPFGASIKTPKDRDGVITAGGQSYYMKDGKKHLSSINKLQDEGDWDSWSRTLASQFLSKQPQKLVDQQIDLSIKSKRSELDEIKRLTNPVVRKKMLEDYANGCDANASSLSVKGFKNQAYQVLLPIPTMKDTEIYAPRFKDGDTVALVRFPHGGPFEIPVLKVNNKQPVAKRTMQNATDAVGVNKNVADRLSGADFDGDSVVVIPVDSNRLKVSATKENLPGLSGFDPKASYKLPDSAPEVKNQTKQREMGIITNLIADMSVAGAKNDEIARAVRHSMVVIDSEKHHLNYKQSFKDNRIDDLKVKYQKNLETGKVGGASTIFSKASSEARVKRRKEVNDVNKMTPEEVERWKKGYKIYHETGEKIKKQITDTKKMTPEELKLHQAGKKVFRETNEYKTDKITKMDAVDDAMDLVRDKTNKKELAYANYANALKRMANEARAESRAIKPIPVSNAAKEAYAEEVASLNRKLRNAQMNAPKERRAQMIANEKANERIKSNPDMDFEHRQRVKGQELLKARAEVGAKKDVIEITDREWEAIQANAISSSKLSEILANANQDKLKKLATPKNQDIINESQIALAKSMAASGMYTQAEIAERLGVSPSTVSKAIRG